IIFRPQDHPPAPQPGDPALFVILVSDPPSQPGSHDPNEPAISDADLAPYGVTIADVAAGNTEYVSESPRSDGLNVYMPTPDVTYYFYSDPEPQKPCPGGQQNPDGTNFLGSLREGEETDAGEQSVLPVPFVLVPGYLVLLDRGGDSLNARTWSDVVIFRNDAVGSRAILVSDKPASTTGGENGITDADLAPYGITTADVINGNTCYQLEGTRA